MRPCALLPYSTGCVGACARSAERTVEAYTPLDCPYHYHHLRAVRGVAHPRTPAAGRLRPCTPVGGRSPSPKPPCNDHFWCRARSASSCPGRASMPLPSSTDCAGCCALPHPCGRAAPPPAPPLGAGALPPIAIKLRPPHLRPVSVERWEGHLVAC
jgi:hypothetical protein